MSNLILPVELKFIGKYILTTKIKILNKEIEIGIDSGSSELLISTNNCIFNSSNKRCKNNLYDMDEDFNTETCQNDNLLPTGIILDKNNPFNNIYGGGGNCRSGFWSERPYLINFFQGKLNTNIGCITNTSEKINRKNWNVLGLKPSDKEFSFTNELYNNRYFNFIFDFRNPNNKLIGITKEKPQKLNYYNNLIKYYTNQRKLLLLGINGKRLSVPIIVSLDTGNNKAISTNSPELLRFLYVINGENTDLEFNFQGLNTNVVNVNIEKEDMFYQTLSDENGIGEYTHTVFGLPFFKNREIIFNDFEEIAYISNETSLRENFEFKNNSNKTIIIFSIIFSIILLISLVLLIRCGR